MSKRETWKSWEGRQIDGKFTLRNLLPGEYLLAAVTDIDNGEWLDPAFLDQIAPNALKLSLAEGEKKTQDIRIR